MEAANSGLGQTPPGGSSANKQSNPLAIVGFIFSILFAPAGLILSIVGLSTAKKRQGAGRGLAVAGIVVSSVMTLFVVIFIIPLIILISIPALQRNSRDSVRRNDVSLLRSELEIYKANNSGNLPSAGSFEAEIFSGASWPAYNSAELVSNPSDAGEQDHILYVESFQPASGTSYPGVDSLHIWIGASCSATPLQTGTVYGDNALGDGSDRSWAIVYQLEGEDNPSCEDNF